MNEEFHDDDIVYFPIFEYPVVQDDDYIFAATWTTPTPVNPRREQFHGDYRIAAEMGFYRRCAQRAALTVGAHALIRRGNG